MSTRAPQRCLKCSAAGGTVVLRRGHRCPFAVGRGAANVTVPITLPPVTATTLPSISLADVHQFDVSAVDNFGDIEAMLPIPPELFDFPDLDLDGPIHSPGRPPDTATPWLIEPPLGQMHPPSPPGFIPEDIFYMFDTNLGNSAGATNFDVDFNLDLDANLVAELSDSVSHLGLNSDSGIENSIMSHNEPIETSLSTVLDVVPVSDIGQLGPQAPPLTVVKPRRTNLPLLTKVSGVRRKGKRVYTFIEDAKKRTKLYSKITNDIKILTRRLHTQTRCYGAVMFASIDSIALGNTKSYFTPNLTSSEGARSVLTGCTQELGGLMSQQWLLSQVDHTLQMDRWRSDAAGNVTNE